MSRFCLYEFAGHRAVGAARGRTDFAYIRLHAARGPLRGFVRRHGAAHPEPSASAAGPAKGSTFTATSTTTIAPLCPKTRSASRSCWSKLPDWAAYCATRLSTRPANAS
jgi:hypothetical protein